MRRSFLVLLVCISVPTFATDLTPIAWLGGWLLPDGFREGYEVRDFIASPAYDSLRKIADDRETLDALYEYAYLKGHGNKKTAVFAMLVAVFEHRTIPLKLGLSLPLSFESEEAFDHRVERLPRYIYNDTIEDRDKLQHFFSGAYAERTLRMGWFVDLLGEAIEILEEKFVSGGANDRRDIVANRDGMRFANRRDDLPSEYLTR
jgi:hypothetical protein